jgi:exodeoxyribonuclease VII large subunit
VPVRADLFTQLGELGHRAQQCLSRRAERSRERYDLTICRWPQPQTIFASKAQRLDELVERLPRSLGARSGHARADMNLIVGRLHRGLVDQRIARLTEKLAAIWKMAELAHPERPLSRGYARITDRSGKTLTHAADARAARELRLHFGDGMVEASAHEGRARKPPVEPRTRAPYVPPQPGLFDQDEE